MTQEKKILIAGATGYVGSKMLKQWQECGHEIHCLTRKPEKQNNTGPKTHIFRRDALSLRGVSTAEQRKAGYGRKSNSGKN